MSAIEVLLVFIGIPLAVVLVVFLAVFAAEGRRQTPRYRPGRPFSAAPVWFLAAPAPDTDAHHAVAPHHAGTAAIPTARQTELTGPAADPPGVKGGARGTW
jgi:hypothetical protein